MRLAQVRAECGTVRDLAAFGGLNRTDGVHDGELAACENLSTRRAPYLATRSAREVVAQYEGADAYYCFDGHTVVCANGRLLFDGEDKGEVTRGAKQFCVVGTKLVLFPDKQIVDVQSGEVKCMDTPATFDEPEWTADTVTFPRSVIDGSASCDSNYLHAYRCTFDDFARAWDGTRWNLDAIAAYHMCLKCNDSLFETDFVMLDADGKALTAESADDAPPDAARCSPNGRYAKRHKDYARLDGYRLTAAPVLADLFAEGDVADISGTQYALLDRKGLQVASVDAEANRITFTQPTLERIPAYAAELETDLPPQKTYIVRVGQSNFKCTPPVFQPLRTGTTLVYRDVDGTRYLGAARDGVFLWDVRADWASPQLSPIAELTPYQKTMTMRQSVPNLDFICEHHNRLWGVCNAQDNAVWDEEKQEMRHVSSRVICASALGEPTKFWQFDGVATDSYQLAVGGEGDFTAICSYGGAVLAFKERKLHKLLGGYPAEYYLTSRDVDGVQAGCAKSLAVVGGALFYKGVRGVYRYEGGTAACVSKKLGDFPCEAVGGTDGRRYYLSTDGGLYVLDTQSGVWLREDGVRVTDFAGNEMLVGDTVWRIGTGAADANTPFFAEFAPLAERDGFAELRYVRLSLEVEIGKGAYLAVEVRTDGAWRTVGTAPSGMVGVTVLRLPPMRCGEMRLRLSGRGDVAVRSLRRQYLKRSDRAS